MNTTILKDEIQWLLEAIKEQFEVIQTYEERIPQIEFDILMDNVRKLYEKMHLLNKTNDPFGFYDLKSAEHPMKTAEPLTRPPAETRNEDPKGKDPSSVKIQYDENNGNSSGSPSAKENQWQNMDLFNTEMPGFSGKLQEARNKTLSPRIRKSNPHDLKAIISINEKFLFINELFDGNLREYNENIETLNRFSDIKSALGFLDVLRKKNLWNSESIAFTKIRELLEERFR